MVQESVVSIAASGAVDLLEAAAVDVDDDAIDEALVDSAWAAEVDVGEGDARSPRPGGDDGVAPVPAPADWRSRVEAALGLFDAACAAAPADGKLSLVKVPDASGYWSLRLLHWDSVVEATGRHMPLPARGEVLPFVLSKHKVIMEVESVAIVVGDCGVAMVRPKDLRDAWPDKLADIVELVRSCGDLSPMVRCSVCGDHGAFACPLCRGATHERCVSEVPAACVLDIQDRFPIGLETSSDVAHDGDGFVVCGLCAALFAPRESPS